MAQRKRSIFSFSKIAKVNYDMAQARAEKRKNNFFFLFSCLHSRREGENDVILKKKKEKSDDFPLRFMENSNKNNISVYNTKGKDINKFQIDQDTFCSYLTKRRKLFKFISYDVKKYEHDMFYKMSDGGENAFLYSTKIKKSLYSDRISSNLYVNCFPTVGSSSEETVRGRSSNSNYSNKECLNLSTTHHNEFIKRKNLFDILYKKNSLLYLFTDTSHVHEMEKYLNDFSYQKKTSHTQNGIDDLRSHEGSNQEKQKMQMFKGGNFIKLKEKQKPINIYYCYVSPYKYIISTYFSKKIAQNLRENYFSTNNFLFINERISVEDEDTLLLPGSRTVASSNSNDMLPSLLLVDDCCYVRYHIKGLFTREASHYLYNVLLTI
ncbi:hypothetical protein, conserved [Plasmodium gonderi]|uniref:Uncharacterized protein n=1 Tax=Plasmodium gonderi TaxID=77519 RepID=A0A1Y1JSC9_PLAGO|nr:hypothetical protein, conserved [Plasmodium gonderi]GAW83702.1 hypothetical protein, conserved [Plasmodium gonderi]